MSQSHLEIERKYELADLSAELPEISWGELDGFTLRKPVVENLDASYFDTPDGRLGRLRVAVRRRLGGYDQGWHVKFDDGCGNRHEVHFDLLSQANRQPAALTRFLTVATLGQDLHELVSIKTRRVRIVLEDASDEPVGEICQDSVHARQAASGEERSWNEWEIEILNPESDQVESLFEQCEYLLAEAGAQPSASPAKIARALGQDVEFEERRGAGELKKKSKKKPQKHPRVETSHVVSRLLDAVLANIVLSDLKLRSGVVNACRELIEHLRNLRAYLRFGVLPYCEDNAPVLSAQEICSSLLAALEPLALNALAQGELAELAQDPEAEVLADSAELALTLAEKAEAIHLEAVLKLLDSEGYRRQIVELTDLATFLKGAAEFPLNAENHVNKIAKRIRKALIAYRSADKSELVEDFLEDVADAYSCLEAMREGSTAWTACQLELRATVTELAERAHELIHEKQLQTWCRAEAHRQENQQGDRLIAGYLWGKSAYYQTGLELAFASFAQQELNLLKKVKMK